MQLVLSKRSLIQQDKRLLSLPQVWHCSSSMEQSPAPIVFARQGLLPSDISNQSRTIIGLDPTAQLDGSEVRRLIKPQKEPNSGNHQVKAAGDRPTSAVSCCRGPPLLEVARLPKYNPPCATAKCFCLTRACAEKQADGLNDCLNDSNPSQSDQISSIGRNPPDPNCSCTLELCLVDSEVLAPNGSPSS